MFEASTVGLHACKLREISSKSPFAFYVSFLEQQNQSIRSCNSIVLRDRNPKRNFVIYCTAQPEPQPFTSEPKPQQAPQPLPSEPKQAPWWRNWTLGAFLSVGVPLLTNKMNSVVKIRREIETKLQTTEDIVEDIRKAATLVEKRAEKRLEAYLKNDEGVPRRVMVYIESTAERIAKSACSVDQVIDMIQDIFLLESPDNDQARKLYKTEKDDKEKAMEVEKEEEGREEKSIEVIIELEGQRETTMEDDKEVKDSKEKSIKDLKVGIEEKEHEGKTTQ